MELKKQFTFWGVRGSTPASGVNTGKIGGHTSCSSIQVSEGNLLIIDTGTGVAKVGQNLMKKERGQRLGLAILYTHFHLDHIQGLPFFAPLYSSRTSITFYSFYRPRTAEACLKRLMGGRLFPVGFSETPSKKIFIQIPKDSFEIGDIRIESCRLLHPQGCRAYRFQTQNRSLVLATDTEHPGKGLDEKLVAFSSGADFLVYDAMYTPAEYRAGKKDWGHSTWLEGAKLAEKAGTGNLYLSHFNPGHSDEKIEELLKRARRIFPSTYAAKEGKRITL